MCYPFNNPELSTFVDINIFYQADTNNYKVLGVNSDFVLADLGTYSNALDAYARCLYFGFEVNYYIVDVDAFTTKKVYFDYN